MLAVWTTKLTPSNQRSFLIFAEDIIKYNNQIFAEKSQIDQKTIVTLHQSTTYRWLGRHCSIVLFTQNIIKLFKIMTFCRKVSDHIYLWSMECNFRNICNIHWLQIWIKIPKLCSHKLSKHGGQSKRMTESHICNYTVTLSIFYKFISMV